MTKQNEKCRFCGENLSPAQRKFNSSAHYLCFVNNEQSKHNLLSEKPDSNIQVSVNIQKPFHFQPE